MEQSERPRPFVRERMRICAFDLDGTLLNGSEPIRPAVRDALKRLSASGRLVVAASGRNATQIEPGLASLFRAIVGSNGAFILDPATGKTSYSAPMDRTTVLRVLTLLQPFRAAVFVQQGHTMISPFATLPCILREVKPGRRVLADAAERLKVFYGKSKLCRSTARRVETDTDPFYKLQVFFPDPRVAADAAKSLAALPLTVLLMADGTLEITAAGVSKANALKTLSESLGLTEANITAFGDSRNDAEMLTRAGHAVVMGNGTDEVKALADTIAPPVWEDGVAVAVDRLFFA
ncbi:MAG: HAD family hydrolase [Clostridia bacterium]|nr:HAD family hydrolase [Clostridia bacterium]